MRTFLKEVEKSLARMSNIAVAPETEDFTSRLTSVALDAVEAVAAALECTRGDAIGGALRAATAGYDTVSGLAITELARSRLKRTR